MNPVDIHLKNQNLETKKNTTTTKILLISAKKQQKKINSLLQNANYNRISEKVKKTTKKMMTFIKTITIFLLISSTLIELKSESIEFETVKNPELNCTDIPIEDQFYQICNNDSFHIKKCKDFLKPQFYKFSNQSKECNPLCGENIIFTGSEKRIGVIVILLMSTLALFTCIVGIINLLYSESEEKINLFLLPVILCQFIVTIGWIVRWVAGRNFSSCGFDLERNSSILIVDGVVTNFCRTSFLLRYFFGMVSLMW